MCHHTLAALIGTFTGGTVWYFVGYAVGFKRGSHRAFVEAARVTREELSKIRLL